MNVSPVNNYFTDISVGLFANYVIAKNNKHMRYIVKRDDKLRFCINATNGQIEPEYYWYIFDDVEKIKITGPRKLEKIVGRCERLN